MNSKSKLQLLIGGVLLMLSLCYQFAISNTIAMQKEYKIVVKEEILFNDIPKQLSHLSAKQRYYDSILNTMNLGNTSMENNLLRRINLEAKKNSLKVIDFNSPHKYSYGNSQINTFYFTLEGDFNSILKTIYALEQKGNFGEVVHIDFQKKRNYNTNKNYLNTTVFLQQYQ